MSKESDFNPFDPAGMFKSVRDANMDVWSKMMIQLVNSDAFAQSTGVLLDTWLSTSAPFRKALETTLTQVLGSLNLPTRADVSALAERLTHIEMRLDDMEAALEKTQRQERKGSKP